MNKTQKFYHSVALNAEKCRGCTNCIKRCPTEAIRVRNGKAHIRAERCIDCGECIKICPHHAKRAIHRHFEDLEGLYEYLVALPAPSLYGQFNNLHNIDFVLNGLLHFGFDDVFEVTRGADMITQYTKILLAEGKLKKPVISSACPAVVRLIRARFPELCQHVLPVAAPYIVAAKLARKAAIAKTGLPAEKIGIILIAPCPAKITDVRMPVGVKTSGIDAVLAIDDIYKGLLNEMNKLEEKDLQPLSQATATGTSWCISGGEARALKQDKYLICNGVENVIEALEETEDGKLDDLDFIELKACTEGCVGGVLTAESPFVTQSRVYRLLKNLPPANDIPEEALPLDILDWTEALEYAPIFQLDGDLTTAVQKMRRLEEIVKTLPGLDCGSCGAPNCRALAEDIVRGESSEHACFFILKNKINRMYQEIAISEHPQEEKPHEK